MIPSARSSLLAAFVVAMVAAPVPAAVHRMFVTSVSGPADLALWSQAEGQVGLAAGDHICQFMADHANGGAGLGGTFVAWLSTPTIDAFCHVGGNDGLVANTCNLLSLPNAGPWVRTDGKPFSRDLQTLVSTHSVLNPPFIDEDQQSVGLDRIHTGSYADGVGATTSSGSATCPDGGGLAWASDATVTPPAQYVGFTSEGAYWWTQAEVTPCDFTGRLACFERGQGDDLPPFAQPGARVFVTSEIGPGDLSQWPHAVGSGLHGVAAGDHVCQALASEAGFAAPSSFVAWLSTAGHPALDRLIIDGPWRRNGGAEVAASKSNLLAATPDDIALESDVEIDDQGVHVNGVVYTGTGVDGQPTGFDCNGWTSGDFGVSGTEGFRQSAAGQWTDVAPGHCDLPRPIYCFSNVVTLQWDGFESGNRSAWDAHHP